jgi:hypothetical protein
VAGCDTSPEVAGVGDYNSAAGRVIGWVLGGAGAFALYVIIELIAAGALVASWPVALAIFFGALAGAVLGFFVGWAVNWFDRLHVQDPRTITISGCIQCAGKNSGYPPFNDNDWTFSLGEPRWAVLDPLIPGLTLDEIRTRDAPGDGPAEKVIDPATGNPILHCEIGSAIGDAAAIGGAIGSVAGAAVGAALGIAACIALGIFTFGIGAALCLLIIAIAVLAGAFAGGVIGNSVGAGIGWIIDEANDLDERGEAITKGCIMNLTGRWITDSSHQHNEIHDIESAQLVECNDCHLDVTGSASSGLIAAVGIGRHPTGRDP